MMNLYKKMACSALALVALSMSTVVFAECLSCKEKMALRQSLKDAAAASLAVAKATTKCWDLDDISEEQAKSMQDAQSSDVNEPCCAECEANGYKCCQRNKAARAPREALTDPCNSCSAADCDADLCLIKNELKALIEDNAACCAVICHINEQVRIQSRDAKKCCSNLKDRIDDVRDEIDDIKDLVESQIDRSEQCCLTMETQINNLQLSIADVFVLLTSVFDCTCRL